jgi:hypothetical protein
MIRRSALHRHALKKAGPDEEGFNDFNDKSEGQAEDKKIIYSDF